MIAVRLFIPCSQHTTGVPTTEFTSAIFVGLLAAAVNPPGRRIRWGVLGYATTMDVSCCYSLPMAMIHRRALATTIVRSLRQQWLLPENNVSPTTSSLGQKAITYQALLPLLPSNNPEDGGTASLPAIPAVAFSFPPPDSSLCLTARLRWSPKRRALQKRPIPTKPPCRYFSFFESMTMFQSC